MIEHVVSALVAALLLGLVANQVTRIVQNGALFAPLRADLHFQFWHIRLGRDWWPYLYRGFICHLCLGQWVAFLVTWAAVAVGLAVDAHALSWQQWVLLATVGPFAVGGVDQLIEMHRGEDK